MGVGAPIYTQPGVIIQPYYNMCPACTNNICPACTHNMCPACTHNICPACTHNMCPACTHNMCPVSLGYLYPVCSAGLCGVQQSGYDTPMGYISTPSNPQINNNIIVYNQNYYN